MKNVHIENDDIIDDFVQKSIFELSDMETIRSNSSEMNEQFLKTIINTLEKGSYRLWLDIAKNRGTYYSAIFNILNELEEDESKPMYMLFRNKACKCAKYIVININLVFKYVFERVNNIDIYI